MNNFIAHRGNNVESCENVMNCLINCLNYDYISGIELDVRETLDQKLILSHNSFLKNGLDIDFIAKNKLKKLKKKTYKIGNSYNNISTLKELLNNIKSNKIILIDIKDKINIHKFYRLIKKYSYLNIYICSFHYNLMLDLKNNYPDLKVGIIIGYAMNNKKDIKPFDFISIHYTYLNKYSKPHFIWTINNKNIPYDDNLGIITDKAYYLQ